MKSRRRSNKEGSIFFDKSKNMYIAQCFAGYDPQTGKAVFKKRTARTVSEAREKLDELRLKYTSATYIEADRMTVSDWLTKWYESYTKPRIRESTQVNYTKILEIAHRTIGKIKLSRLTPMDIQSVIFKDLGQKYRTAQYFRVLVKAALKRAVANHLIRESPAEFLELPAKPPKKPFAKPTPEAWTALLNYQSPFYFWRMIILTEYVTGLRRGELLALRWKNLAIEYDDRKQLKSAKLSITNAIALGIGKDENGRRRVIMQDTKTPESHRTLRLPLEYCRQLLAYKKEQAAIRLKSPIWTDNGFIFCHTDGRCINPAAFTSLYAKVRKKLGIKTTFHMLRHDMASRMKKSGQFDMKDIQAQLGHSTIQITMDIYTHIDDEGQEAVSCWLEDDLGKLLGTDVKQKKA